MPWAWGPKIQRPSALGVEGLWHSGIDALENRSVEVLWRGDVEVSGGGGIEAMRMASQPVYFAQKRGSNFMMSIEVVGLVFCDANTFVSSLANAGIQLDPTF